VHGGFCCHFTGVIASLGLSDDYCGDVAGDLLTEDTAAGTLRILIEKETLSDDWNGVFHGDTLTGTFSGILPFSYEDADFEATYEGVFQATRED